MENHQRGRTHNVVALQPCYGANNACFTALSCASSSINLPKGVTEYQLRNSMCNVMFEAMCKIGAYSFLKFVFEVNIFTL